MNVDYLNELFGDINENKNKNENSVSYTQEFIDMHLESIELENLNVSKVKKARKNIKHLIITTLATLLVSMITYKLGMLLITVVKANEPLTSELLKVALKIILINANLVMLIPKIIRLIKNTRDLIVFTRLNKKLVKVRKNIEKEMEDLNHPLQYNTQSFKDKVAGSDEHELNSEPNYTTYTLGKGVIIDADFTVRDVE